MCELVANPHWLAEFAKSLMSMEDINTVFDSHFVEYLTEL